MILQKISVFGMIMGKASNFLSIRQEHLCKALWGIMNSYHQVVSWHQRKDSQKLSAGETDMILLLIQSDTVFSNI